MRLGTVKLNENDEVREDSRSDRCQKRQIDREEFARGERDWPKCDLIEKTLQKVAHLKRQLIVKVCLNVADCSCEFSHLHKKVSLFSSNTFFPKITHSVLRLLAISNCRYDCSNANTDRVDCSVDFFKGNRSHVDSEQFVSS